MSDLQKVLIANKSALDEYEFAVYAKGIHRMNKVDMLNYLNSSERIVIDLYKIHRGQKSVHTRELIIQNIDAQVRLMVIFRSELTSRGVTFK